MSLLVTTFISFYLLMKKEKKHLFVTNDSLILDWTNKRYDFNEKEVEEYDFDRFDAYVIFDDKFRKYCFVNYVICQK